MKNALIRSKENYKEYRNSRYKKQPLHLGLKGGAQGRAFPHIPKAESLRKAWSWFTGWQRSFCDAYNLLSRVPGKVICWRHCATKSLERIAWESSWQLRAAGCSCTEQSGAGKAVWTPAAWYWGIHTLQTPGPGEARALQKLGMMQESSERAY